MERGNLKWSEEDKVIFEPDVNGRWLMGVDPYEEKAIQSMVANMIEIEEGASTSLAIGEQQFVKVKVLPNYNGNYRLEYDGKYVTLLGEDKDYKGFNYGGGDTVWYEEMVLSAVVAECRNASPAIKKVTGEYILITLN